MFVDELGLCGRVRVDVAVLNGAMAGYELKSATDTLRRLPLQVEMYSKVLDRATLVVAENHRSKALSLIPDWWGCIVAHWCDGAVKLQPTAAAADNPHQDAVALAMLLWREEALQELHAVNAADGRRSWTRQRLCKALADEVPLSVLRDVVRERLKGRAGWRSAR